MAWSSMLNNCNESNSVGRGRSDFNVTVYLSGVSIAGPPLAVRAQRRARQLRIAHAQEVPLDVVAGELATRVVRHAFAQVEGDRLVVGCDVPALGQSGLGLGPCRRSRQAGRTRASTSGPSRGCGCGHPRWPARTPGRRAACRRSWAPPLPRLGSGRRRGCRRCSGRRGRRWGRRRRRSARRSGRRRGWSGTGDHDGRSRCWHQQPERRPPRHFAVHGVTLPCLIYQIRYGR